jgi:methanethiol S-methyltransferase
MNLQHVWLVLFWILYGFLHSLFASPTIKRTLTARSEQRQKYYRLAYTLFAFVTLAMLLAYQFSISSIRFQQLQWLKLFAGLPLLALGGSIMMVSIVKYFRQLSGITAVISDTNEAPHLEETGLHRYVRHPLYLGTIMFVWGLWLWMPLLSHLIAVSVLTAYTLVGIRFEEQKLVSTFGDQYIQYRKRVPMIIPFLK